MKVVRGQKKIWSQNMTWICKYISTGGIICTPIRCRIKSAYTLSNLSMQASLIST